MYMGCSTAMMLTRIWKHLVLVPTMYVGCSTFRILALLTNQVLVPAMYVGCSGIALDILNAIDSFSTRDVRGL